MSGYKVIHQKRLLKNTPGGHFSQVKLPHLDKRNIQPEPLKALHKIKSGKLPGLKVKNILNQSVNECAPVSQLYERCSSEVTDGLPHDIE